MTRNIDTHMEYNGEERKRVVCVCGLACSASLLLTRRVRRDSAFLRSSDCSMNAYSGQGRAGQGGQVRSGQGESASDQGEEEQPHLSE